MKGKFFPFFSKLCRMETKRDNKYICVREIVSKSVEKRFRSKLRTREANIRICTKDRKRKNKGD